jgi:alkanesulfonate monooxygenase SsuD/methylene tetrahydromethanopterin reductase-like flavin-dependent oxidoreductase (luciferase family)
MRQIVAENGRPLPTVGVVPPTTIAETEDEAWAGTSLEGLLKWANERGKWWVKPPSGRFETAQDIEGSLIAGTPRWGTVVLSVYHMGYGNGQQ